MVTACSWVWHKVSHVNLPKGRSMSHQTHPFFPFPFFSQQKTAYCHCSLCNTAMYKNNHKKNPCLIDCLMLMAIRHVFLTSPPCYIEHQAPGFHSDHNSYIIQQTTRMGLVSLNRWRAWIATALRAIVNGKRINTPRNWMINWNLGNVFPPDKIPWFTIKWPRCKLLTNF